MSGKKPDERYERTNTEMNGRYIVDTTRAKPQQGISGLVLMFKDTWNCDQSVCLKYCSFKESEPGQDTCQKARRLLKYWREIRLLRRLEHDHIIRLRHCLYPPRELSSFQDAVLIFDGMQKTMTQVLQEPDEIPLHRRRKYIFELLLAVHHIHSAGIMHRDIKPANILLDDQDTVKLCDFGLSRAWGTANLKTVADGSVDVASLGFKAPETASVDALTDTSTYSPKIDIFAIGVLLSQLLQKLPSRDANIFREMGRDTCFLPPLCHLINPTVSYLSPVYAISVVLGLPLPEELGLEVPPRVHIVGKMGDAATEDLEDYYKLFANHGDHVPVWTPLDDMFAHADSLELDLLRNLLHPDHRERFDSLQALSHPYFDSCDHSKIAVIPAEPVIPEAREQHCTNILRTGMWMENGRIRYLSEAQSRQYLEQVKLMLRDELDVLYEAGNQDLGAPPPPPAAAASSSATVLDHAVLQSVASSSSSFVAGCSSGAGPSSAAVDRVALDAEAEVGDMFVAGDITTSENMDF